LHSFILDGDNIRAGLCRDLGFSDEDRVENIRRVSEIARLMQQAGLIVIVAFISPFRQEREFARSLFDQDQFFEIFIDAPLEICEKRDPKGLYRKARQGLLKQLTGIDSPYETPCNYDLKVETTLKSVDECVDLIIQKTILDLKN
jgi:adenylyl-sulfate kinase